MLKSHITFNAYSCNCNNIREHWLTKTYCMNHKFNQTTIVPDIARTSPTSAVVKLRPPVDVGLTHHKEKICIVQIH
jgi:hypothetical protein